MTDPDRHTLKKPPTYSVYAGQMLTVRLTRMLSHLDGVRAGIDGEPVHQMRVWARRTRAALDMFAACADQHSSKRLEAINTEVKLVGDALGNARDMDVMAEHLTKASLDLPVTQRAGVESLVAEIKAQRKICQQDVEVAIDRLSQKDLSAELARLIADGVEVTQAIAPITNTLAPGS